MSIIISVVTPTYNRVGLLKQTVDSILEQTVAGLEYIIVDDGSTDGTSEYLDTLPASIKKFRVPNGGQVRALNIGWAEATGRYLAYLSDDDLLRPHALEALVDHLETNPNSAAVFPNSDLIDLNGLTVQTGVCRPFSLEKLVVDQQCFIGPGAVFRREAYEAIGDWDERCKLLPDLEFWMRLALCGTIDFLPRDLALYRVHAGSLSIPSNRSEAMAREYEYVVNKFFDNPDCPSYLRTKRSRALANAHLTVALSYLRTWDARRFYRSIAMARQHDIRSLNVAAAIRFLNALVPLSIKQKMRRAIRH